MKKLLLSGTILSFFATLPLMGQDGFQGVKSEAELAVRVAERVQDQVRPRQPRRRTVLVQRPAQAGQREPKACGRLGPRHARQRRELDGSPRELGIDVGVASALGHDRPYRRSRAADRARSTPPARAAKLRPR